MLIVLVMDVSVTRLLGIINCDRYADNGREKKAQRKINAPFSIKSQVFTEECVYAYGLGLLVHVVNTSLLRSGRSEYVWKA